MNGEGHKERLRERFIKVGIRGFEDYEILELLLSYIIIRKDCKSIAKEMIYKYGNLSNILGLSIEKLSENKYITKRSAIYFKLIHSIIEDELYNKIKDKRIKITTNIDMLNYIRHSMGNLDVEMFRIIYLNTANEIMDSEVLFKGTLNRASVYMRELVKKVLEKNAKSIVIVHNHPSGNPKPSRDDEKITKIINEALQNIEIILLDHIIITIDSYYSFREGGII